MRNYLSGLAFCLAAFSAQADDYVIDGKGTHTFVQFKASHLGYSWLYGRFNDFSGEFSYDPKDDSANKISMTVDVTSIDTNHSERDKHLRGDKFLDVEKNGKATFVSKSYTSTGEGKATLVGDLTLMGITKEIKFDVDVVGGGNDPWGGYRQGFEARATLSTEDFGMKSHGNFPKVDLIISVEGCKKPTKAC